MTYLAALAIAPLIFAAGRFNLAERRYSAAATPPAARTAGLLPPAGQHVDAPGVLADIAPQ